MESTSNQPQGESSGDARVVWGMQNTTGGYAGKSVSDVRGTFASLWRVPEDAQAYVGGTAVDQNYVLKTNDTLEFHRRSGEKG